MVSRVSWTVHVIDFKTPIWKESSTHQPNQVCVESSPRVLLKIMQNISIMSERKVKNRTDKKNEKHVFLTLLLLMMVILLLLLLFIADVMLLLILWWWWRRWWWYNIINCLTKQFVHVIYSVCVQKQVRFKHHIESERCQTCTKVRRKNTGLKERVIVTKEVVSEGSCVIIFSELGVVQVRSW